MFMRRQNWNLKFDIKKALEIQFFPEQIGKVVNKIGTKDISTRMMRKNQTGESRVTQLLKAGAVL